MASVKCDWIRTEAGEQEHDFGFADAKGRAIGLVVEVFELTYSPAAAPSEFSPVREPGKYFCFLAKQTRDGKPFGASHIFREYRTQEQARVALESTIREAKSRYRETVKR